MDIEKIDYESRAVGRVLHQFRGKSKLEETVKALVAPLGGTQEALDYLMENTNIDDATGPLLDKIGKLVNVYREGSGDDEYRVAIRLGIILNNSSGTLPEVENVVRTFTGSDNVLLFQHDPYLLYISIDGDDNIDQIINILGKALPIGVTGVVTLNNALGEPEPGNFGFRFSELLSNSFETVALEDESGNNIFTSSDYPIGITIPVRGFEEDAIFSELPGFDPIEGKPFPELYHEES